MDPSVEQLLNGLRFVIEIFRICAFGKYLLTAEAALVPSWAVMITSGC